MNQIIIIVNNEEDGMARCMVCAHEFEYDVHTEEGLYFNEKEKRLMLQCPKCKTKNNR